MTAGTIEMGMRKQETTVGATEFPWRTLYRVGGVMALSLVLFTFFQATVYMLWPPPSFDPTPGAVNDWFAMLRENRLIGLLNLDLVMLVDYPASLLVFLALYVALRRANPSLTIIAFALGATGIVSYFAVNPAFAMSTLSDQFAAATTEAERTMAVAAGQAILAAFKGSGFNASYTLIGLGGLVMSIAMLRSAVFGKLTAWLGIIFYAMGLVPATAGTVGFVLSMASLLPMIVWLPLLARGFFRLAREVR